MSTSVTRKKLLIAAAVLVLAAVGFALPVRVLVPGPVLPVTSDSASVANLFVPTVYVSSKPVVMSLSCQVTRSCQTATSFSFPAPSPADDPRAAALTVPGVSEDAVERLPDPAVAARGYSSELGFALYYVTGALQTILTCPVAASGTVTSLGQVGPVAGEKLKAAQVGSEYVLVTFADADIPEGDNVVRVSSVVEAYGELVARGCVAPLPQ